MSNTWLNLDTEARTAEIKFEEFSKDFDRLILDFKPVVPEPPPEPGAINDVKDFVEAMQAPVDGAKYVVDKDLEFQLSDVLTEPLTTTAKGTVIKIPVSTKIKHDLMYKPARSGRNGVAWRLLGDMTQLKGGSYLGPEDGNAYGGLWIEGNHVIIEGAEGYDFNRDGYGYWIIVGHPVAGATINNPTISGCKGARNRHCIATHRQRRILNMLIEDNEFEDGTDALVDNHCGTVGTIIRRNTLKGGPLSARRGKHVDGITMQGTKFIIEDNVIDLSDPSGMFLPNTLGRHGILVQHVTTCGQSMMGTVRGNHVINVGNKNWTSTAAGIYLEGSKMTTQELGVKLEDNFVHFAENGHVTVAGLVNARGIRWSHKDQGKLPNQEFFKAAA